MLLDLTGAVELPQYQCHKIVGALKIAALSLMPDGDTLVQWEKEQYPSCNLGKEFVEKHKPEVGGYLVVYEDGYRSYSPAKAFESGYLPIDGTGL